VNRLALIVLGLVAVALVRGGGARKGPPVVNRQQRLATHEERDRILEKLTALGWPRVELDKSLNIESGWDARAFNPVSHAAGINQIMPAQLARLGWKGTALEFSKLEPLEQLPYMVGWWTLVGRPWRMRGDTYLALAAPAYVGAVDGQIVYRRASVAWRQNPAWRPADGGDITAGSIRSVLIRRLSTERPPPPPVA
jgi:hypothetical protein